jgi:CDP-diacylglycerol pyrophosphatase
VKKVIISIIAVIAAVVGLSNIAEIQDRFSCSGESVVVSYGDTMWNIIDQNCTGNKESARNYFVNKYGPVIYVGQVIELTK